MSAEPRPSAERSFDDVRMRGFARRSTVAEAWSWLDSKLIQLPAEELRLQFAAGRVLSQAITSSCDVPGFDRSMMDGVAVRAEDTHGASPYNRLPLQIIGDALPGRPCGANVSAGQ